MGAEFGAALRAARRAAGLSQHALAVEVGVSQGMVAHWESGRRGVEQSPDLVPGLEQALGLPAGSLAQYLPRHHPARRMAAVEIPLLGGVGAGPGREDATDGETLRVSSLWLGCVAYRVSGSSMTADAILDGDYLVVQPAGRQAPTDGDRVVAWLSDQQAHVCKRLRGNHLVSENPPWSHRLTAEDEVMGTVVAVIRLLEEPDKPALG